MAADPGVEDEDPVGHKTHALAPAVLEYVPAGHKTHTVELLAPAVIEYAPGAQLTHAADELAPVAFEYVPALEFVHDVVPNWRTLNRTCVCIFIEPVIVLILTWLIQPL